MSQRKPISLTKGKAKRLLAEYRAGKKKLSVSQIALFELIAHGKKPTRLKNPRAEVIEIAPYVNAIEYEFRGKPHGDCDEECKEKGHHYRHDYDKDFQLCWVIRGGCPICEGRLVI